MRLFAIFAGVLLAAGLTAAAPVSLPEIIAAAPAPVPVLMYHRATTTPEHTIDISPDRLRQHLRELARLGYTSISMRLWAAAQADPTLLPDTPVVITFDDGWEGQYRYAAPLLEEYGFTGTFYIYTNVISEQGGTFMGWRALADLIARGHEIGGHTLSHPNLTRLRPEKLTREVTASKTQLAERLGITVSTFAYPYGAYNDQVLAAVTAAGYQTAVSTNPGANAMQLAEPYLVRRLNVGHRTTPAQLVSALNRPLVLPLAALTPPATATILAAR